MDHLVKAVSASNSTKNETGSQYSDLANTLDAIQPKDPEDPQEISKIVSLKASMLSTTREEEAKTTVAPPAADPLTGVMTEDEASVSEKKRLEEEGRNLRQKVSDL